jgi:hypothetical protein
MVTCANTCERGDTFILDYSAIVPVGEPGAFVVTPYNLHLNGTVAAPVTLPAAFWLLGVLNPRMAVVARMPYRVRIRLLAPLFAAWIHCVQAAPAHDWAGALALFEPNSGRYQPEFGFIRRQPGMILGLRSDGLDVLWYAPGQSERGDSQPVAELGLRFIGGTARASMAGQEASAGSVNYFVSADPAIWRRNIALYESVVVHGIYPGIDVHYHLDGRWLEFDFIVAEGVDPSVIRMKFSGAHMPALDDDGHLVFPALPGMPRLRAPVLYQDVAGRRQHLQGHYRVDAGGVVTFSLPDYDTAQALVIDPVLEYSSYLGGSGSEDSASVAVGADGDVYIAGYTTSPDLPVLNSYQESQQGFASAYVARFSLAGPTPALVYATYIGNEVTEMRGLAVSQDGSAYVTGSTSSTTFPLMNALQGSNAGLIDAYVVKLAPAGDALSYSTYVGGNSIDRGRAITIDAAGAAYVTGVTASTNFPVVNAWQAGNAGALDAYVLKVSPSGAALEYSTYLGGTSLDYGAAIALDGQGRVFIGGNTSSLDFPVTNAVQSASGGANDAIVVGLDVNGGVVVADYIGGGSDDFGTAVGVDAAGLVYVAGQTQSSDFPIDAGSASALSGERDAFIVQLDIDSQARPLARYLGGSGSDVVNAIEVEPAGIAHIGGSTDSVDFPLVDAFSMAGGGQDGFVLTFDSSTDSVLFASLLGGAGADAVRSVAEKDNKLYLAGSTDSADFPLQDAMQTVAAGGTDNFLSVVNLDGDGDGANDYLDNCPARFNAAQNDKDGNGVGDACEPPRLTGIWPADAAEGETISLFVFGDYFDTVPGATQVSLNGIAQPLVQVVTPEMLIVRMTVTAGSKGPVTAVTANGTAVSATSFGTPAGGLTIDGIWPASAAPGDFVFVFGSGYGQGMTVALAGTPVPLVQVVSGEMFVFVVPAGASTGPVTITTASDSVTSGDQLLILP